MSIKIDLKNVTTGTTPPTNFRSLLIRLLLKADRGNRERLRLGYPNTVRAVEHYQETGEILDLPDY